MAKRPKEHTFEERLEKTAQSAMREARMILPGILALFGFQLIAMFNQGFYELPSDEQRLHFAALVLVTLSIAMVMAPASYYRIVEKGSVSLFFVRLISLMLAAAMVPLMLALCLEVYLAGILILQARWASAIISGALLLVFVVLWFAFPLVVRSGRLLLTGTGEPWRPPGD
jgi:hypothetical protein